MFKRWTSSTLHFRDVYCLKWILSLRYFKLFFLNTDRDLPPGVWTPAWPSSTLPGGLWGWCCSWWRAGGSVSSGKYFSLWISKIILCRQEEGQGAGGGGQRGVIYVMYISRKMWYFVIVAYQVLTIYIDLQHTSCDICFSWNRKKNIS